MMAAKKKQSAKKPVVKQAAPKKKRKVVKVKALPKRRLLDKALTLDTQIDGGNVNIYLNTGPEVSVLEVAVNGRSVWKGQP